MVVGISYFLQRQFIYYPKRGSTSPKQWNLPQVKLIQLRTSDGLRLNAWYHPNRNKSMPTIVYFHGNYGYFAQRANRIEPYIKAGYGLLLLSYRGYGGSEGSPTEQGLYRDGRAAIDFLKSKNIKPECMVLYGVSIGTGVAVQMAIEYPVGALILQSSFTSLVDLGNKHYFILPMSVIIKDRFNSLSKIDKVFEPKLFIHGKKDSVIPFSLGRQLFDKARSPKRLLVYPLSGHNDLPGLSTDVIHFLQQYRVCQGWQ